MVSPEHSNKARARKPGPSIARGAVVILLAAVLPAGIAAAGPVDEILLILSGIQHCPAHTHVQHGPWTWEYPTHEEVAATWTVVEQWEQRPGGSCRLVGLHCTISVGVDEIDFVVLQGEVRGEGSWTAIPWVVENGFCDEHEARASGTLAFVIAVAGSAEAS